MTKYRFCVFILILLFLSSCGAAKRAAEYRKTKDKLETQYQIYKGIKYKYGGTDKRGFDCSGLTQTVYKKAFNRSLPRTTKEMGILGKKIAKHKLKPGDLVFFRPSRKYRHMGIFIGDDLFMHSSTSKGVTKSRLSNPYWKKKYRFARRILNSR